MRLTAQKEEQKKIKCRKKQRPIKSMERVIMTNYYLEKFG
jgi:hypothetical protein